MKKIVITGAGSAQSNGVINCLKSAGGSEFIIGIGSDPHDLNLCHADKKYLFPHSKSKTYKETLLKFLRDESPDFIHFQHDQELYIANSFLDEIKATGVDFFLPDREAINTCVFKHESWKKFVNAGIKVPRNLVINNSEDIHNAFEQLTGKNDKLWFRSMDIGGGGKGAFATDSLDEASQLITRVNGWGNYVAAELLSEDTVTWLSIWHKGKLVVAQTRIRKGWAHSALSVSGVTGVTRVGETFSDSEIDRIAKDSIFAVSDIPNGVYGVDMAYDFNGVPNPTEINIGRFFTTVEFFAKAGINFPAIYKDIALYGIHPNLSNNINPLENGLLWIRGMDCEPILTSRSKINKDIDFNYSPIDSI